MKKLLLILGIVFGLGFVVNASVVSTNELDNLFNQIDNTINDFEINSDELSKAVEFMYENGITIYNNVSDYNPDRNIRRDESAKVFYRYFEKVVNKDLALIAIHNPSCEFNDLKWQTFWDLLDLVEQACTYKLFKWSNWKFYPTQSLTNWQAVVVLIRMIDEKKDEINVDHYAENYIQKADDLWLLDWLWIKSRNMRDKPASRKIIALLLYRAMLIND